MSLKKRRQTERTQFGPVEVEPELTPKEHLALLRAARVGWFAVPRKSSLADLSEYFGINEAAVNRLLRSATERVMLEWSSSFFDVHVPRWGVEHVDEDLESIAEEIGTIEEVREGEDGRVVVVSPDRDHGRAEEERELRRQLEADVDGGPR